MNIMLDQDRACLNCGIVQVAYEFLHDGCPNCEQYLKFKGSWSRVLHCSSNAFHGLVTLPEGYLYWLPRIGPVGSMAYGVYAKYTFGVLPWFIICDLARAFEHPEHEEHTL